MIQGTPFYSEPFDMRGGRSFRMLVHRSAVPQMLGSSVLVHVETAAEGGGEKLAWVGMDPSLRVGPGEAVWASYEDARQYIRFHMPDPQSSAGLGITIEFVPEP